MLKNISYTILGFALAFIFFPHASRDAARKPTVAGIATQNVEAQDLHAAPEMAVETASPNLTAKSAIAYDVDSGTILYSKNLDEKLPIASLTKLMTALIVVEHGNLNADVVVDKSATGVIGSTMGLLSAEKIKVIDLLQGLLIPSSNDAAIALAEFESGNLDDFARLMNQEAQRLGMSNTHYDNPVGYDSDQNYSNTLDLLKLTQEVMKNAVIARIVDTKDATVTSTDGNIIHKLRTTNQLLLDDSNVEGVKTGFTERALGNLIIQYNHNGSKVISVVLGSENREQDSQKLLDWLFKVYRW